MDVTSIITQVGRPEDEADFDEFNNCTLPENGSLGGSEKVIQAPPVSNRKVRPSFLSSLLCCFGTKSRAPAPPPSPPECPVDNESIKDQTDQNQNPPEWAPECTFVHPQERVLLPPLIKKDENKFTLIIDLDETLVHSSFKPVENADFIVPVEIDGTVHEVYVLKRPYVDEFLQRLGDKFECVLFTASLAKYADPVADLLDKWGVFRARLFRESCVFHRGNYVKDLSRLGRDIEKVLIIDNSPASYAFHPENAVGCQSWFDDPEDTELLDIIPFLENLTTCSSVYDVLRNPENR